jgi:uncharacterized membrane protein
MSFFRQKIIPVVLRLFFGVGVIWGLYFLRDNLWFRAYPLVISSGVWGAFIFSLRKEKMPLIERSVRTVKKELTAAEVKYCHQLTIVWAIFMTLHLGVTLSTLFLSYRFWAFYNGCLSYLLMGLLFLVGIIIGKWRKLG